MKKILIKIASVIGIGMLAISLASCGKKITDTENGGDIEYRTEFTTIELNEGDNLYYNGFSTVGNNLICVAIDYSQNEVDADSYARSMKYTIIKYDLTSGEKTEIPLVFDTEEGYSYPSTFSMLEDGSYIGFLNSYSEDDESIDTKLVKLKKDGSVDEIVEINGASQMSDFYVSDMVVTKDSIYVTSGETICKLDLNGSLVGKVDLGSYIQSISATPNGRVYVAVDADMGMQIKRLNEKGTDFDYSLSVDDWGNAYAADDTNILFCQYTSLVKINVETNERITLFDWVDVDVNTTNIDSVHENEDGTYTIAYQDYEESTYNIVKIREALESEKGTKVVLNMGVSYLSSDLRNSVVNFNRSSDKARIKVTEYFNGDSISYEDALKNFGVDLANGKYDLVCLNGLSFSDYVTALEPLNSYCERDLDTSDYFNNILDVCSVDGKRYGLTKNFYVQTLAISKEHADEIGDWTVADLLALRNKYSDKIFLQSDYQTNGLAIAMSGSFDKYVDFKTGKCNFDTDEFRQILEFAKSFKSDEASYDNDFDEWEAIRKGDIILIDLYINSIETIQLYDSLCPGGIELIGYPTNEGGVHKIDSNNTISMSAKCKNKDLAWEFIKEYLNQDYGYSLNAFSVQKSKTDAIMKDAMKKTLGPDGNEISTMSWGNGFSTVELYAASQDEVDMMYDVFNKAINAESYDSEVMEIISEECQPYFKGQKSADETIKVIQSRVSIFLAEKN